MARTFPTRRQQRRRWCDISSNVCLAVALKVSGLERYVAAAAAFSACRRIQHRWSNANVGTRLLWTPSALDDFRPATLLRMQSDAAGGHEARRYTALPRLYVGSPILASESLASQPASGPALGKGVTLTLSPDQTHYLVKVMRIFGKGSKKKAILVDGNDDGSLLDTRHCVRIFDGKSGEWLARISIPEGGDSGEEAGGKQRNRRRHRDAPSSLNAECLLQLRGQDERQQPWLIFAPIKKQRAKLMIEKCTELGAGLFVPIMTDRTDPGAASGCLGGSASSSDGLDKLVLQALEASEQCERLTVPGVVTSLSEPGDNNNGVWNAKELLQKWCCEDSVGKHRILMICREREAGNAILPRLASIAHGGAGVAFLIGPEGGWSQEEEMSFDECCSRSPLVESVSLGSSVLRAETAAIIAVGAWALDDATK